MIIKKRYKSINVPNSIGVMGAKSGCGVTHVALLLANFLSSAQHYSVNYVEVCKRSQIYNFVSDTACYKGEDVCYRYKGVDYFPNATFSLARRLLLDKTSITIIDIGIHSKETYDLIDKCERILVVGSVMPWCVESFQTLVQSIISNYVDIHKIKFCVRDNRLGRISGLLDHRITLTNIPEGVNPFAIRQSDFEAIQKLL